MAPRATWTEVSLGDVAREITVGHVGSMVTEYVTAGVPFLRSLNVDPYRINLRDIRYISPAFHGRLSKSRLGPGDVVIVRTGKPGTAAVVPVSLGEANCSDLVIVRPGPRLDPRYLAYYLNSASARAHVDGRLVGAVQQHFNVAEARAIRLPLPSIEEQRAIAGILGALDDKIDLNRRLNATLEAIARTLFRSWFVDFDPVRANAEGRQSSILDAATAALFPDAFDNTTLGPAPRGWTVCPIGDVVGVRGGSTPSTTNSAYWANGTLHWATPRDMSRLTAPILLDTERKITIEGLSQVSSGLLPPGSLLMSSRAPIGYLAVTAVPSAVNQGFIAMLPSPPMSPYFLYFWASTNMEVIEGRANGTTFMEVSRRSFRPIPILVPDGRVLATFAEAVAPMFDRITNDLREIDKLAATRDYLLPRLLSGEVRVRDADYLADAAS